MYFPPLPLPPSYFLLSCCSTSEMLNSHTPSFSFFSFHLFSGCPSSLYPFSLLTSLLPFTLVSYVGAITHLSFLYSSHSSHTLIYPSLFIPSFPALSPLLPSNSVFVIPMENTIPFYSWFLSLSSLLCTPSILPSSPFVFASLPPCCFPFWLLVFPLFCVFPFFIISLPHLLLSTLCYNDGHNDALRRQLKDKCGKIYHKGLLHTQRHTHTHTEYIPMWRSHAIAHTFEHVFMHA